MADVQCSMHMENNLGCGTIDADKPRGAGEQLTEGWYRRLGRPYKMTLVLQGDEHSGV